MLIYIVHRRKKN